MMDGGTRRMKTEDRVWRIIEIIMFVPTVVAGIMVATFPFSVASLILVAEWIG